MTERILVGFLWTVLFSWAGIGAVYMFGKVLGLI